MNDRTCPHCNRLWLNYKRNFRKDFIHPLKVLVESDGPMNTNELSHCFSSVGKTQNGIAHFPELRFWRLIEPASGEKMRRYYVHTQKAVEFLQGRISIPKYLFTDSDLNVIEDPEDEAPAPMVYVHDIEPGFYNEPIQHVEDARPATLFDNEDEEEDGHWEGGPDDPSTQPQPELPHPGTGGHVQDRRGKGIPGSRQSSVLRSLLRG